MKEIKFVISADGEITIDVKGAVGAECDTLTAPFEESLGLVQSKERKPAFFETDLIQEQDQNQ